MLLARSGTYKGKRRLRQAFCMQSAWRNPDTPGLTASAKAAARLAEALRAKAEDRAPQ